MIGSGMGRFIVIIIGLGRQNIRRCAKQFGFGDFTHMGFSMKWFFDGAVVGNDMLFLELAR